MHLDSYNFEKYTEKYYYEFFSVGPKGTIKKLVCFRRITYGLLPSFNLNFGDGNESSDQIDEEVVTNNKDSDKVLQTVVSIVLDFLQERRNTMIIVRGRTPERNRLYRMFITKFRSDIDQDFLLCGKVNDKWQSFATGTTYDGFSFIYKPKFLQYED